MSNDNPHLGLSFEDFLTMEGIREEATMHAIKLVLAWQIEGTVKVQGIILQRQGEERSMP